jgi:hypothetical protein
MSLAVERHHIEHTGHRLERALVADAGVPCVNFRGFA